jgi:hypothetical protein
VGVKEIARDPPIATWSNSIPWHPRRISPCGQRHAIEQQVLAPDIDREVRWRKTT